MQLQQQQQQQHRRHCHSSSSRFVACMSHSVASPRFSRPFNCHMASCTQRESKNDNYARLATCCRALDVAEFLEHFKGQCRWLKLTQSGIITCSNDNVALSLQHTHTHRQTHTGSAGMQHELSSPKGMTSLVSLAWPGNCIFGYISLTFWAAIKNEQK